MVDYLDKPAALLAAATLLLIPSCGAPDLTYRSNQPDAGADAFVEASADAPSDVSADTATSPDAPADASPDALGDASADVPDDLATMDQQSEQPAADASDELPADAAADTAQEASSDATADSPADSPSDAPDDVAQDQQADSPIDAPPDAPPTCPVGMADVPQPNATIYCVDATEVRAADYEAWLATSPTTVGQPPGCEANADFTPASSQNGCTMTTWDPAGHPELPVVCVDWCDAFAYCAAQGKRLCGDIGGGNIAPNKYKNGSADQWYRACSKAGSISYPYGNAFVAASCNGAGYGANAAVAVGTPAGCVGGYAGLHDMSGNVQEWEDSCDGTVAGSQCRVRGGGFTDGIDALRCDADLVVSRMSYASNRGFRCCGQ